MTQRYVYVNVNYPYIGGEDGPATVKGESMREELLTIRQMCDRYSVTARTLRFYESKELLSPVREGQKRLFTKRDRARLKLILRGKRFGFALEEIRQLLALYDMGDQQQTQLRKTYEVGVKHLENLRRQRDELNEAIADLSEQLAWGARKIAAFETLESEEQGQSTHA